MADVFKIPSLLQPNILTKRKTFYVGNCEVLEEKGDIHFHGNSSCCLISVLFDETLSGSLSCLVVPYSGRAQPNSPEGVDMVLLLGTRLSLVSETMSYLGLAQSAEFGKLQPAGMSLIFFFFNSQYPHKRN